MTVVVALGFALFDVVVMDVVAASLAGWLAVWLSGCLLGCLPAMSVYFTCKQITVPAVPVEFACARRVPVEGRHPELFVHAALVFQ